MASQAFGTAHGACGTLHARAPSVSGDAQHASYPVQFDDVKSYSPKDRAEDLRSRVAERIVLGRRPTAGDRADPIAARVS